MEGSCSVLSGLVVDMLSVGELTSGAADGLLMRSSLSRRPEKMSRASGAGFSACRYSRIGGTEVILLVRTLTSILAWTMDILMLKGATSYARLCHRINQWGFVMVGGLTSQYPSIAHCDEQYMPRPGVPR